MLQRKNIWRIARNPIDKGECGPLLMHFFDVPTLDDMHELPDDAVDDSYPVSKRDRSLKF